MLAPWKKNYDKPRQHIKKQNHYFADKVKVAQVKVTHSVVSDFCDPMDNMVHGILQARILAWVVFPFSRGFSQPRDRTQVSRIAGRFFTN